MELPQKFHKKCFLFLGFQKSFKRGNYSLSLQNLFLDYFFNCDVAYFLYNELILRNFC